MASNLALAQSTIHPEDSFLKVNRMRMARTLEYLNTEQCHLIELLPLLFHINHSELPGYVSKSTVTGISQYSPTLLP